MFVIWLAITLRTRFVAAGSIAAAATLPVLVWFTPHRGGYGLVAFSAALAIFVIFAHRANVARLRDGTESRFGMNGEGEHGGSPLKPTPESDR